MRLISSCSATLPRLSTVGHHSMRFKRLALPLPSCVITECNQDQSLLDRVEEYLIPCTVFPKRSMAPSVLHDVVFEHVRIRIGGILEISHRDSLLVLFILKPQSLPLMRRENVAFSVPSSQLMFKSGILSKMTFSSSLHNAHSQVDACFHRRVMGIMACRC